MNRKRAKKEMQQMGMIALGIVVFVFVACFTVNAIYPPVSTLPERNSTKNQTPNYNQTQKADAKVNVSIKNFTFSPSIISIPVGQEVNFVNNDSMVQTITADDSSFDSGEIQPGQTYKKVFDSVGLFGYHSALHPSIKGKVEVK